ncbi:hypothetical protein F5Y02DRAFT_405857 [Annulohypoxylon stygium]|nr:hypothetical protein F5Y02DRAFT_405857 [Annulohypoxylon stygium]
MAPSREQLLKTANLCIESFNEFTPEAVTKYLSPSCRWMLKPKTLKAPPRNRTEFGEFIGSLKPAMPGGLHLFVADGQEPAIDVVTRKVTLYLKSRSETKPGLYENEYVWVITMNEDGTEVEEVIEFVDSLYTDLWLPKLNNAAEEATTK